MPLLSLSPERIAFESRRAEQEAVADRVWRRRLTVTLLHAGAWYGIGLLLLLASFHATGLLANWLMYVGWLMGNVGPISVLIAYWLREHG